VFVVGANVVDVVLGVVGSVVELLVDDVVLVVVVVVGSVVVLVEVDVLVDDEVVVGCAQGVVVADPVAVRCEPSGDLSVQTRFPVAGNGTENAFTTLPGANTLGC
jgi:hypothetical protein